MYSSMRRGFQRDCLQQPYWLVTKTPTTWQHWMSAAFPDRQTAAARISHCRCFCLFPLGLSLFGRCLFRGPHQAHNAYSPLHCTQHNRGGRVVWGSEHPQARTPPPILADVCFIGAIHWTQKQQDARPAQLHLVFSKDSMPAKLPQFVFYSAVFN